jgi:hypothetical protein
MLAVKFDGTTSTAYAGEAVAVGVGDAVGVDVGLEVAVVVPLLQPAVSASARSALLVFMGLSFSGRSHGGGSTLRRT